MKLQLIMLPNPIVVSDEQPVKGYYFDKVINQIRNTNKAEYAVSKLTQQIIAGIPELPSIDFSALSDEDCKRIGWVDVERLAEDSTDRNYGGTKTSEFLRPYCINSYKHGFKTAQSLNDKKYSEEDMKTAMLFAMNKGIDIHNNTSNQGNDIIGDYIQLISQPKVFDIEYNLENNSIKIIKTKQHGTNQSKQRIY